MKKKVQLSSFRLNPVAVAITFALASQFPANVAQAGSGWGAGIDLSNTPVKVPTFYANSPTGPMVALDVAGATTINAVTGLPVKVDSGKALRKFVDTLPGVGAAKKNNLNQYIPVAVAEKWVDGNGVATSDDYYEIAAVEYTEKMHSDLPKATHLRGYVQLMTPGLVAKGVAAKAFTTLDGRVLSVVDVPHHLGPIVKATKGTAVRVKFTNLLPVGAGGNLFIPVDTTIPGAGNGPDGTPYTQNRAVMHLIGGNAPWISAGTAHQWVAPADEVTNYPKGASNQNVPDMAEPGPGSTTMYFPNDVSARFTFIQDRTSGLTRLNAYAGLESAYSITDAGEQSLIASKAIPADQIPLIIEDKTFVPANIAQQDAKWDTVHWGQPGDLWFPHVYETNQDPNSIDGTNPVGRWDFGPWFWPIFPATQPLPTGEYGNASSVPDSFFDTPLVNGTAYPTLTVEPRAYRFRVLNASNDRYLNLGWYKADATKLAPQLDKNGNPIYDGAGVQQYFINTEVKMVPALADASGNPLVPTYADACLCQYPTLTQVNSAAGARAWPLDARVGGAPDPAAVGPDFIAIGNDGGLLPNPVDIPSQPIVYEANKRSITVNNVYSYGLLLGPSERADTIVDFSSYAGQTLILYNDAPAPVPFNDQRLDYYTGNPDFTTTGGANSTLPGYGPNTRTVMQVKVSATPVALTGTFNADTLKTALPAAYGASQAKPIVPAVAYNKAFGTNDTDIIAHIATGSLAQQNLEFSSGAMTITGVNLVSSGGAGSGSGTRYDPANPPIVAFNNVVNGVDCAAGVTPAAAHATVNPVTQQVSAVTLDNPYVPAAPGVPASGGYPGYTCAPTITFTNPPGTSGLGAQAIVVSDNFHSIPVQSKAEQELFNNSGRYNYTGGIEMPFTNAVNQTTIPLNFIDTATEVIADGETQIWKIVVNGLFTNSVHFNFVDVQLLNRVGWDGTVKMPAANEVGWKDTLRLNPLEDMIVAVRAKRATVPFGLPRNSRPKDPAVAIGAAGSGMGFTVTAPAAANPAATPAELAALAQLQAMFASNANAMAEYDNEFAWYCSNLSHSEDDFMRPIVFHANVTVPAAPGNLTDPLGNGTLTWTDPTPAGAAATLANPQNEIGFKILQASLAADGITWSYTPFLVNGVQATVPANTTNWTQPAANVGNTAFAVVAYNAAGDSAPSTPFADAIPVAPTTFTGIATAYNSVTLNWSGNTTNNSIQIWRDGVLINTLPGTATSYVDATVTAVMTYNYTITVVNNLGTASAGPVPVVTPMIPVAAPTGLTATPNAAGTAVTVRWTDNANNETAYQVDVSVNGGAFAPVATIARTAAQRTAINGVVTLTPNYVSTPGNVYVFSVTAVNVTGGATSVSAAATATADLSAPAAPAAPSGLTATLASATRVALAWVDNASTENSYLVTITNTTTNVVTTATVTRTAAQRTAVGGLVPYNATVVAGNSYSFTVVAQATQYGLTTMSGAAGPVTMDVTAPVAPTAGSVVAAPDAVAGQIVVTWADASSNESGFTVQRSLLNAAGTTWGAWGNAGTVAANVATFTDTGRITGRQYRYQVRANGVVGNSVYVGPSNAAVAP